MEKLIKIQKELKAPKGQYNSFGKYKYRSAEDILEAVKPLCAENGVMLTLSDTLEYIGDRYYVKATATVTDKEDTVTVTAYAREEETKKGMDGSQITGTASSYARKYALNGLFLIDDTKDADTDEYKHQMEKEEKKAQDGMNDRITQLEASTLEGLITSYGAKVDDVIKAYKVDSLADMTKAQYGHCCMALDKKYGSQNKKTVGAK